MCSGVGGCKTSLQQAKGRMKIAQSNDFGGQCADLLDPDFHHITRLKELAARRSDSGRRAGKDQVAWVKRHGIRELLDLLCEIENHVARVGVLLENVIHP